jgi:hypothetical protein
VGRELLDECVNLNQRQPRKGSMAVLQMLEKPPGNVEIPDQGAVCDSVVRPSILAITRDTPSTT